jgi:hypothetical protein
MHIHDTLQSKYFVQVFRPSISANYFGRDDRPAVQSFGSGNCRLTASLFHAKIAPAALHCGKIICSRRDDAEAAGPTPEFWESDFCAWSAVPADRPCAGPGWHEVKQRVPDA